MFISIDITLSGQGERLSHAVGCAFAVCLERKQKRDKDCAVSMNFDNKNSTFTRLGSFRQATITERLQDPQMLKPSPPKPSPTPNASSMLTPTNDSVEKRLSADSRYALTNNLEIRLCDNFVQYFNTRVFSVSSIDICISSQQHRRNFRPYSSQLTNSVDFLY